MNEIYLFGDSAAQGIVLDESENYRVSRAGCIRLMKHSGYPIRNYAVHGYTVNQGLESFRNLKTDPGNICVIEFGGNDCDLDWDAVSQDPDRFHDGKTPLVDFMNLLKLFVREAKGRNLDPVLVTPLPIMSGRYYRWVSKRRDADRILKYLRNDPEFHKAGRKGQAGKARVLCFGVPCRICHGIYADPSGHHAFRTLSLPGSGGTLRRGRGDPDGAGPGGSAGG